jgi:hypothetical protein
MSLTNRITVWMLIACFVGGPIAVAIAFLQWWLLGIAALFAGVFWFRHWQQSRRRRPPMLRIACEQCGEALTLVAASNLAPDGYVVTNPACPHCGARKW